MSAPRPVRRATAAACVGMAGALLLAACAEPDDEAGGAGGGNPDTMLTVLAAASLTDVLTAAGEEYEAASDGEVGVRFSFAGSQELASQVRQAIPADALITADTATMAEVEDRTAEPEILAQNTLSIVTTPGNPHHVTELSDLANDGVDTVLAATEVPAGRYARDVLSKIGVPVEPVSEEANVRSVLSKVILGEADAGVVYTTDAVSTEEVTQVELPSDQNITADYPAAVLESAATQGEAEAFVDWLAGPEAAELWQDAGFERP